MTKQTCTCGETFVISTRGFAVYKRGHRQRHRANARRARQVWRHDTWWTRTLDWVFRGRLCLPTTVEFSRAPGPLMAKCQLPATLTYQGQATTGG